MSAARVTYSFYLILFDNISIGENFFCKVYTRTHMYILDTSYEFDVNNLVFVVSKKQLNFLHYKILIVWAYILFFVIHIV